MQANMSFLSAAFFATLVVSISAAPAFVWKGDIDTSSSVEHSSVPVHASTLISSALTNGDSSLDVFFLVGRKSDGSDGLGHLASTGALRSVASKYDSADTVYHNVDYLSSARDISSMVKEALDSKTEDDVMEIDLIEFNRRLSGKPFMVPENPSQAQRNRERRTEVISKARVLVVKAAYKDSAALDAAVSSAIESGAVNSVVLAGHRSTDEVRMEREMKNSRRMKNKPRQIAGRRRLEDEQADDDGNNNNEDLNGVYYVNMTPNIFSGILFAFLFIFVTTIGINCLNAIEGQDYYVSKYPVIGREA